MNKIIPAIAVLVLILAACKNDKSQQTAAANTSANVTVLAGHWIAIDFCSRAKQYGSVLQAVNNAHLPFAYAFSFTPAKPDSVEYFNGFMSKMLPVVYKADTLEIKGAREGNQSVHLVYNSNGDKSITMFDPQPSGVQMDKFIKSKAGTKDCKGAFLTALNHNLLSGNFQQIGAKGGPAITFTPGGFITNFKDFDRFTICTGGDCLVAGNEIDVVTFSNSKQEHSDKIFGFRYSNHNDTLSVVTLSNDKPDPKAAFQIGKPVYKFARTKME
jgi:hypothetical protein